MSQGTDGFAQSPKVRVGPFQLLGKLGGPDDTRFAARAALGFTAVSRPGGRFRHVDPRSEAGILHPD